MTTWVAYSLTRLHLTGASNLHETCFALTGAAGTVIALCARGVYPREGYGFLHNARCFAECLLPRFSGDPGEHVESRRTYYADLVKQHAPRPANYEQQDSILGACMRVTLASFIGTPRARAHTPGKAWLPGRL